MKEIPLKELLFTGHWADRIVWWLGLLFYCFLIGICITLIVVAVIQ